MNIICTLIFIGLFVGYYFLYKYLSITELFTGAIIPLSILFYVLLLFLSLILSDKYIFANYIAVILSLPLRIFGIILPWFQQIIYFFFVVLFPAALICLILRFINVLQEYHWSNLFIYFISYTIGAILSSSHRIGDFFLKITLTKKIFQERMKIPSEYDQGAVKYLIYTLYFIFLFVGYLKSFYLDIDSIPKEISASFLVYIAYDRLNANRQLTKSVNRKVLDNLFKEMKR